MFAPKVAKTRKASARQRQSEIVARLFSLNLSSGFKIFKTNDESTAIATFERRLRLALESFGLTFAAFGSYLSSRVDLLPAAFCLELAEIKAASAPLSFASFRVIYNHEIGREPEADFLYVADAPFETQFFYQKFKAWLPDESAVAVKLVNPESERLFAEDAEILSLLAPAFTRFMSEKAFARAVEDFRRTTALQLDLKNEARELGSLEVTGAQFSLLYAPKIYGSLSTAKILTVEQPDGISLADLLKDIQTGENPAHSYIAAETARSVCAVWLQQTLYGSSFPVVTDAANVILTDDKRIAFTDCAFAVIEPETQLNLRRYLKAAAMDQADTAADFWIGELNDSGKTGESRLRQHLRQIVIFRDSDWYRLGMRGQMLNFLLTQWRAATESGFTPKPALPSFYRGLFGTAMLAERLAPEGKSLIEGLEDARLLANLADFRKMLSVERLFTDANNYGSMMVELPHRFDEFLRGENSVEVTKPKPSRTNSNSAAATALMLLAGAIVLLAPQLTEIFETSVWLKRFGIAVFLLCGVWLLRIIGRTN